MQVLGFPGCCTARVITGFGQENNAGWEARQGVPNTIEDMKIEVDRLLRGPQIGRHYGLVFATLTTRQTMGIQALTEMGWLDTGAKDKRGHNETDLHGFYISPIEYLTANPNPPNIVVPPQVPVCGMVKDLRPEFRRQYNSLMRQARSAWSDEWEQRYRARAREILTQPGSFLVE